MSSNALTRWPTCHSSSSSKRDVSNQLHHGLIDCHLIQLAAVHVVNVRHVGLYTYHSNVHTTLILQSVCNGAGEPT